MYPLTKSPSVPQSSRKLHRYTDQSRRNTYTLQNASSSSSSSTSDHDDNNNMNQSEKQLINRKQDYVRFDSQGFDPQQENNLFNTVQDARLTFSIPQKRFRFSKDVNLYIRIIVERF